MSKIQGRRCCQTLIIIALLARSICSCTWLNKDEEKAKEIVRKDEAYIRVIRPYSANVVPQVKITEIWDVERVEDSKYRVRVGIQNEYLPTGQKVIQDAMLWYVDVKTGEVLEKDHR